MPELAWTQQPALGPAFAAGRSGEAAGEPGVRLSVMSGIGLIQVMARRGQWQATVRAAESCFGVRPPEGPAASFAPGIALVWSGPGQFLALSARERPKEGIQAAFTGIASLSDQSHGRVLFRLAGPKVVDTLAKVASVDLDPTVFPVDSAAVTSIDHTGATLWREPAGNDGPVFGLLVFTSFSGALWRLLLDSAAEFGVESSTGPIA